MKNEIDSKEFDELAKFVDEMSKKQKESNDTLEKKECCICMEEKPSYSFDHSPLVCGHSFCGSCKVKCKENNGKCPFCRCPMASKDLYSKLTNFFNDNIHLYQMIDMCKNPTILNLKQDKLFISVNSRGIYIFLDTSDPEYLIIKNVFKRFPLINKETTHRVIQKVRNSVVNYTLEELRQMTN
jgi:hypothetical protein